MESLELSQFEDPLPVHEFSAFTKCEALFFDRCLPKDRAQFGEVFKSMPSLRFVRDEQDNVCSFLNYPTQLEAALRVAAQRGGPMIEVVFVVAGRYRLTAEETAHLDALVAACAAAGEGRVAVRSEVVSEGHVEDPPDLSRLAGALGALGNMNLSGLAAIMEAEMAGAAL